MHRGWPVVAVGVGSADRSGPHEFGHAERKVERLPPVEARVADGLVAVVEMLVEDLVRATKTLGDVVAGELHEGAEVTAAIDAERRDDIRRNHTATHILHWALREVLGDHVKQAGSHVGPDRLRFDFSHFEAVTQADLDRIEALANREVISDAPVRHYETSKSHAESIGAIAFFGDKYGEIVRVLEAGPH